MNNKKQTLAKAIGYKNYAANDNKSKAPQKSLEKKQDQSVNKVIELRNPIPDIPQQSMTSISAERLREAVIWSEILDKPLSKRRKRR